jgi:hypothetical protein
MKKRNLKWTKVITMILLLVLVVGMVLQQNQLRELTNQLSYLQDTDNIILSDVGGLQTNIQKTLEAEASMMENYSIDVTRMDFESKTYDVEITAIPKEYTDKTQMSVYFGTQECKLQADGYLYRGTFTLSFQQNYDGNVTFLLAEGKKKSTEVLTEFESLSNHLDEVLTGSIDQAPTCRDEVISLNAICNYQLDGIGQFEFEQLEMVAQLDDEEIWTEDLLLAQEKQNAADRGSEWVTTETQEGTAQFVQEPVADSNGSILCEFSYDMEEWQGTEDYPRLRIYLRAVSADGYRFEYDLFSGDYLKIQKKLDPQSYDWSAHPQVYDLKGVSYSLDSE